VIHPLCWDKLEDRQGQILIGNSIIRRCNCPSALRIADSCTSISGAPEPEWNCQGAPFEVV